MLVSNRIGREKWVHRAFVLQEPERSNCAHSHTRIFVLQRAIQQRVKRGFVLRRTEHARGVGAHDGIRIVHKKDTQLFIAVVQFHTAQRVRGVGANPRVRVMQKLLNDRTSIVWLGAQHGSQFQQDCEPVRS